MGVFKWFDGHAPERLTVRSTNVPVQQLSNGPGDFSDLATRAWENELGGVPAGVRPRLADSLDEVILNAVQHSQSAIGCIVAGQAFPRTKRVEACVLDTGIGIPEHLARAGIRAASDAEYIVLATEEGVTGTSGTLNSGVGLYELRSFVEAGGGVMTILSGQAYVVFRAQEPPFVGHFWGGFRGTLVNLQFDTGIGLPFADMDAIL